MSRFAIVEIEDGPRLRCFCTPDLSIHVGDQCVVEADKTLEFGKVSELDQGDASASSEKGGAKVLRCATLQDQAKAGENGLMNKMAMDTCLARAKKYGLEMRLGRVRYSFDRKVLMVLFTAEKRVDFREMVKELAGELHTRIEMKQIGVRDEAGHIGGIGPCGRSMCCCSWLHKFDSINVKMAKTQGLSLNPSTISGMCGRLKCCLRFENDQYKEMARSLPREGSMVECSDGCGRVIGRDILRQRVKVCLEKDQIMDYDASDLKKASSSETKESRKEKT
ncbi:MAG: stage 0 sporulation protein [Kiritimatiellae bacterium]|nr:stage 0 sporulation protein [Kiritimatiellia bacterium]